MSSKIKSILHSITMKEVLMLQFIQSVRCLSYIMKT